MFIGLDFKYYQKYCQVRARNYMRRICSKILNVSGKGMARVNLKHIKVFKVGWQSFC